MNASNTTDEQLDAILTQGLDVQVPAEVAAVAERQLQSFRERIEGRKSTATRRSALLDWGYLMKRNLPRVATLCIVLLVLGLAYVLLAPAGGGNVTFAEVIENVRNVQACTLRVRVSRPDEPIIYARADTKGASERTVTQGKVTWIGNAREGKCMSVDHERKMAWIKHYKPQGNNNPIDRGLADLADIRAKGVEDLGEKQLAGRKVIGFRAVMLPKTETQPELTVDFWVDPNTGLPVQFEVQNYLQKAGWKLIVDECVWNPDLDDSLFDLTPPEGYQIIDETQEPSEEEQ